MAKKKETKQTKKAPKKKAAARKPKRILADVMSSTEIAAHRRKNGIVLLPLGCFEMHGVQACMSCDTFIAQAACRVVAEEWDAVIFPPIHYAYPGASAPWPGTVRVLPRDTLDYVIAVTRAIIENGFKKVILISFHMPNNPMLTLALREVFEEMGEIPMFFSLPHGPIYERIEKEFGQPHQEAGMLLGALHIVGRADEFDPSATKSQTLEGPKFPFPGTWDLKKRGAEFPHYFVEPNNHVGRYPGLEVSDAPRLAKIFREEILKKAKGLPKDYDQFQKSMWKAMKQAPWKDLK